MPEDLARAEAYLSSLALPAAEVVAKPPTRTFHSDIVGHFLIWQARDAPSSLRSESAAASAAPWARDAPRTGRGNALHERQRLSPRGRPGGSSVGTAASRHLGRERVKEGGVNRRCEQKV